MRRTRKPVQEPPRDHISQWSQISKYCARRVVPVLVSATQCWHLRVSAGGSCPNVCKLRYCCSSEAICRYNSAFRPKPAGSVWGSTITRVAVHTHSQCLVFLWGSDLPGNMTAHGDIIDDSRQQEGGRSCRSTHCRRRCTILNVLDHRTHCLSAWPVQ